MRSNEGTGTLRYRGLERHTESLRKLFGATAKDVRVLMYVDGSSAQCAYLGVRTAYRETHAYSAGNFEIYAPIADRLGMSIAKQELEDAASPTSFQKNMKKRVNCLKSVRTENEERLESRKRVSSASLGDAGIRTFHAEARVKGIYSLYLKLGRRDWDIDKIYDILALRVVFQTVADCYSALGIIHAHWRPVPGKIKDYIAFPKPNGYQSIHDHLYW